MIWQYNVIGTLEKSVLSDISIDIVIKYISETYKGFNIFYLHIVFEI